MDIIDDTTVPAGTVLVGIDGSPWSQQALEWAARHAEQEHRALTVVHGTPTATESWTTAPGHADEPVVADLRRDAEQLIERARAFVARQAPCLEVNTVYRLEDPQRLLVELSARAASVVVGSRGRGPNAGLQLGSVGVAVVRHASCPVVVLRPTTTEQRAGVVVGVDATDDSADVLEVAFRHAATTASPLTVVHSWAPGAQTAPYRLVEREHVEQRRQLVSRAVAELGDKYPDVFSRIELTRTPPAEALVSAARGAGLVVVGLRRHEPVGGVVHGPVAMAVVERAPTTVAVVPAH